MQLFPDFQASFQTNYTAGKNQLVWAVLPADLETPVSAMMKVMELSPYHFLFESVQGGQSRGRYSIIGLDPDLIWKCEKGKASINRNPIAQPDNYQPCNEPAFTSLRTLLKEYPLEIPKELPPMPGGLFGFMSYDMVRLMEKLPDNNPDTIGIPEGMFIRPRIVVIFDTVMDSAFIVTTVPHDAKFSAQQAYAQAEERIGQVIGKLSTTITKDYQKKPSAPLSLSFTSNFQQKQYHQLVNKAKEYIVAGDIFQVVPSQRFTAEFTLPPFAFYRSLRHLNPSPYLFYVKLGDFSLIGSSPEILCQVRNGKIVNRPLAGTRKRGKTPQEDTELMEDLLADEKERAEHLMLVDLGRNDVGRVAKTGTVKVTEMMVIEFYSHVMHISSNVEGQLAPQYDAIDALIAAFPVGTVSGAPKIRAMEIIDELEPERRSFYAGGVGYFSVDGSMDTCIALRTALIKDNKLYLQAGGGVVADSDPEAEYQETVNKASALMRAAEKAVEFV